MPKKIRSELEFELKGQLREVLKCESGDEIEFYSIPNSQLDGGSTEKIQVVYKYENGNGVILSENTREYIEGGLHTRLKEKGTIDSNIAAGIVGLDIMSGLVEGCNNGDAINSKEFVDKCLEVAKIGKTIAHTKMYRDDNGNITTTELEDKKTNGDTTNDNDKGNDR